MTPTQTNGTAGKYSPSWKPCLHLESPFRKQNHASPISTNRQFTQLKPTTFRHHLILKQGVSFSSETCEFNHATSSLKSLTKYLEVFFLLENVTVLPLLRKWVNCGYTVLSNHWLVPNLPFLEKISNKTNYWLTSVSLMVQTRDIKLEQGHGSSHTSNYLFSQEVWHDINSTSQTSFLIPWGMKYLSLTRGDTSKGPTEI